MSVTLPETCTFCLGSSRLNLGMLPIFVLGSKLPEELNA